MKGFLKYKRIWLVLLVPIGIVCVFLAKISPFIAEYIFARGIYRIISIPLGLVTGYIDFSISELIICLLPVLFIVYFMYNIIKKNIKKMILNLICFFSIMFFLFIILCGCNYYRYDFERYCNFTIVEYSDEQLYNLCIYLLDMGEENYVLPNNDFYQVADEAETAYDELSEEFSVLKYSTGRAKSVFFSKYMSYLGIVGIYMPYTIEANVDTDVLPYKWPAITCHEMAHLRGFMKEEEANYISYLACTRSENKSFRYSGYMLALDYSINALYKSNITLYDKVIQQIPDTIRNDLIKNDEYWKNIRKSEVAKKMDNITDKINDTYLKANGQEEGLKSYGMMVDLLIGDYLYNIK